MGTVVAAGETIALLQDRKRRSEAAPRARARPPNQGNDRELFVYPSEVVGLAGLGGHGQTTMLMQLFNAARRARADASVEDRVALIAGDRQTDGIFPLWSIALNIGITALTTMTRWGLIDPKQERALAENWRSLINIRTPDVGNNILSLSGGNQQKALFARALATEAGIVLMDDPMRGVDVGTKREVYSLIRGEADKGRMFVWYTTEIDELAHCDHVYVFRNGRIIADFARGEVTEEKILRSSFQEGT
jgi:ribose transport system ATP-binding protein